VENRGADSAAGLQLNGKALTGRAESTPDLRFNQRHCQSWLGGQHVAVITLDFRCRRHVLTKRE
jgi:hypothetical protein